MTEKNTERNITLVECPRDAMQGWAHPISTSKKVAYLNQLLKVGFDTLDFGSFVSPKAIPQLADTKEVLSKLDLTNTSSKLLAIVANTRGASEAAGYEQITYLGFPFSVSETFQQRNTNSSIEQALITVDEMHAICEKSGKQLVVYISMGFGNPYGDEYNEEIVTGWISKLAGNGIRNISIADTVGMATPEQVNKLLGVVIPSHPSINVGVHLHASVLDQQTKVAAALEAGCLRFDGALKGIGGCPMAGDELVGNISTEIMIAQMEQHGIRLGIDKGELQKALYMASEIFI